MNIPVHVAIIMDRNGAWAKKRLLSRIFGHREGMKAVRKAISFSVENNIKVLSLFAFSTENWNRPKSEVNLLFSLLNEFLKSDAEALLEKNIKILFSGDIDALPEDIRQNLYSIANRSINNTGLILNVAFNYGGKAELVYAFKNLFKTIIKEGRDINLITEDDLSANLYHPSLPPVDLLIRTGGEQRLSNFMLWQMAYAELYFPKVYWPDFSESDFEEALRVYSSRERRFGRVE